MKKLNSLLLALCLGLVLVTGQSPVIASQSSVSPDSAQLAGYSSTEQDYSVTFGGFGPDILTNLTQDDDGTYHLITDSNNPQIRTQPVFSGFTMFDRVIGNDSFSETVSMPYAGQLFFINNGEVSIVGAPDIAVPLTAETNVLTWLYVGYTANGNHKVYHDTRVVRVSDADDFAPIGTVDIPLESTVSDDAANTDQLTTSGVLAYNYYTYSQDRQQAWSPEVNVADSFADNKITLSGSVNSSGFFESQSVADFQNVTDAIEGVNLVIDASGVKYLDTAESVTAFNSSDGSVLSPYSVVSLSPYGYWDYEQGGNAIDWDVSFSVQSLAPNAGGEGFAMPDDTTPIENGATGWNTTRLGGSLFGTIDYLAEGELFTLKVQGNYQTNTVDSPGFGIVATLFATAAIAYVAPRMKKNE